MPLLPSDFDRVLLVEDDAGLCALLEQRLSTEGFIVECAHDGMQGLEMARSRRFVLVVLDVMLPKLGGFDVLRKLRATSAVPVLILTARGDDIEKVLGLESGADDYLAKPFNPRELIARMRAILRRSRQLLKSTELLEIEDVTLDPQAREVTVGDMPVHLTSTEFTLLQILVRKAGAIVSREELTEEGLGHKLGGGFDRSIDVHVSNLRKKLGPAKNGERIKAVRGSGYLYAIRSNAVRFNG
jgi:two-component system response regulator CpxR